MVDELARPKQSTSVRAQEVESEAESQMAPATDAAAGTQGAADSAPIKTSAGSHSMKSRIGSATDVETSPSAPKPVPSPVC